MPTPARALDSLGLVGLLAVARGPQRVRVLFERSRAAALLIADDPGLYDRGPCGGDQAVDKSAASPGHCYPTLIGVVLVSSAIATAGATASAP